MNIKKQISLILLLLLFSTVIYAEENTKQEETIDLTEIQENEITDPELLDRIRIYNLNFSGTKEMSLELTTAIKQSLEPTNMPIDVLINDQFLKTDVDAIMIYNRVYVPFRAVVEAFNFTDVTWNEEFYKATFKAGEKKIEFLINTQKVMVDKEETFMDTPAVIVDGRTMVPIRFISELLGFQVEWDPIYYSVSLHHDTYPVNQELLNGRFYTVEEMKTFSKLVMKEAGSVSYETKHGVASVVMNQVKATSLENTITGVIYDESRMKHFPPAHKEGFDETIPNKDSVLAVKKTLRGENSVGSCIFFNTSPFKGKTVYKVVDGVYFCY